MDAKGMGKLKMQLRGGKRKNASRKSGGGIGRRSCDDFAGRCISLNY